MTDVDLRGKQSVSCHGFGQRLVIDRFRSGSSPLRLPIVHSDDPFDLPIDLPIGLPIDLPIGLPIDLPIALPIALPIGLPFDLPIGLLVDLPFDLPFDLPIDLPIDLPVDLPVNLLVAMPPSDDRRRVCVIGAGLSGLPAIKACLEQGMDVLCFERTSDIGGLWNYRPEMEEEMGGTVMRSTVVNTSKEMMAFSDFPPPEDWPNFMHHSLVNEYIHRYAQHFQLTQHIVFNTNVLKAERLMNGGWQVEVKKKNCSESRIELFDFVMLCTGHHSLPYTPTFPGLSNFHGRILHAHSYRSYEGYEGKRVFIVGIGNSALDIAVELARVAKSVVVSTRRGSWIFNRCAQGGMPYDTQLMTRYYTWLLNLLPFSISNDFMEHRVHQRMDHDLFGLRPNHRFFQQHPTVNDALANLLASGFIQIVGDIERVHTDGVFVNEGRFIPADVIISCTGYTFAFPFLRPVDLIPVKDRRVNLYKFVFPPAVPDLVVIGLVQPIGSISPISEIQSRWAVAIFSGRLKLPSISRMQMDIVEKQLAMQKRYFASPKHTVQVDYCLYMDEIAEIIGCKPSMFKYLINEPRFWLRLFIGANVPYVYRLEGEGKWTGARRAIEQVPMRVKKALKHRQCRVRRHKRRGITDEWIRYSWIKCAVFVAVLLLRAGLCSFSMTMLSSPLLTLFIGDLLFCSVIVFLLLWFDLQYDMSTIL